jgi:hypothetical protein
VTAANLHHGRVRAPIAAVLATFAGAAVAAAGWRIAPQQWFYSYLVAWLYWAGIALGGISLLLLHNLTGGAWGEAIRPALRAAAATLPFVALLFMPIALKVEEIYPWADSYEAEQDPVVRHKQAYLNVDAFRVRAGIYFAVWFAMLILLAWQARSRPAEDTRAGRRLRRLSGQGLALHGLAVTFASIDWMMSLEPHWFSTTYGVVVFASQGLTAFALAIVVSSAGPLRADVESAKDALHDLGKLLLGFLMFWAYVSFSQFLIIWYGNLPEEIVWYTRRWEGGWRYATLALVLLHFVVPFVLLLSRELKRNPRSLGAVALLLAAMNWLETAWMIEPAVSSGAARLPWIDLGLTAAIGGVWCGVFLLRYTPQET